MRLFLLIYISCLALAGCGKVAPVSEHPEVDSGNFSLSEADIFMASSASAGEVSAQEKLEILKEIERQSQERLLKEEDSKRARYRQIQKALKDAGYYEGKIDGRFGPKSKAAVKKFQKAQGLVVDGKVGSRTWASLRKFSGAQ